MKRLNSNCKRHTKGLLLVALAVSLSACANEPASKSDATNPVQSSATEETRPTSSNPLVARWSDQFRVVVEFTFDKHMGGGRVQRRKCIHDMTFSRTDSGWDVESDYTIQIPSIPASDGEVNELWKATRCALPAFTLDADGNMLDVAPLAEYEAARKVFLDYYNRKGGERGLGESVARLSSHDMKRLEVEGFLAHSVPPSWSLHVEEGESVDLELEELEHVLEASIVRLEDVRLDDMNHRVFKSEIVSLPGPEFRAVLENAAAPMDYEIGDFRIVDEIHYFLDPEIGIYRGAVGNKTIEGGTFTGEDALGKTSYVFELKSYQPL